MKYSVKHLSKSRVELTISVYANDLARVKKLTLAKMAQKVKVSGFRPGKVPASVAEKHLDPASMATQVAEDAASQFVIEAFASEKLQPLERPEVDIKNFKPGETLELTAEADILPAIKLGEYKKLGVKREKVSVSEKEVNEVIENLRRSHAEKTEVKRAAKKDDEVWIDFEGVDEKGEPVSGAAGKDYPLALGSNTFIPGFEDGLMGKKTGDSFDLPLTFPKDYHHAPLAGAKVTFKTSVKKITESKLPEADDSFAAKNGDFKTVNELRADIKAQLTERKKQEVEETYRNALLDAVLAKSDVPAPEVLIQDQMQSLERDMQQNLLYRGLTLEAYLTEQKLTKDEWLTKELRPTAEKRVKIGLLLAELSKLLKVEVSQGELNAQFKQIMQQNPNMKTQLDTPEARRDIANRILTEKTLTSFVEAQA
ncbi:MAG TPA: trigger factor [Candidatus Saccharimonadales bacterium]